MLDLLCAEFNVPRSLNAETWQKAHKKSYLPLDDERLTRLISLLDAVSNWTFPRTLYMPVWRCRLAGKIGYMNNAGHHRVCGPSIVYGYY